jgi:hypothetical protein
MCGHGRIFIDHAFVPRSIGWIYVSLERSWLPSSPPPPSSLCHIVVESFDLQVHLQHQPWERKRHTFRWSSLVTSMPVSPHLSVSRWNCDDSSRQAICPLERRSIVWCCRWSGHRSIIHLLDCYLDVKPRQICGMDGHVQSRASAEVSVPPFISSLNPTATSLDR